MSCMVKSSGFSTFFTSPVSERTRSPTAEKVLTEIFKYSQQLIQTYVNAPTMIFQQPYFTLFKKPFMNSYRRRFSFLIPLKYGSEIGGKKMALSES